MSAGNDSRRPKTKGEEFASVDDKGRLLIDSKQRECLEAGFVLSVSEYECLQIFPQWRWNEIEAEVEEIDPRNQFSSDYFEEILGKAKPGLKLDSIGRIQLPPDFRDLLGVDKGKTGKVKVVGDGRRYQVWNPEELANYRADKPNYRITERKRITDLYEKMMTEEARIRDRIRQINGKLGQAD